MDAYIYIYIYAWNVTMPKNQQIFTSYYQKYSIKWKSGSGGWNVKCSRSVGLMLNCTRAKRLQASAENRIINQDGTFVYVRFE